MGLSSTAPRPEGGAIEDDAPTAPSTARVLEGLSKIDPAKLKAARHAAAVGGFVDLVRAELAAYLEMPGRSQADVAKGTGYSVTYVSQFLNDKFPAKGKEADFARAVSGYLKRAGRRADRLLEPEFVETRPALHILAMLQDAHDKGQMVLTVGRSGVGKTQAAHYYTATNEGVIYILAGEQIRAPRAFLSHLAGHINLPTHLRFEDLFERAAAKLKDSGRVLIVDEAEHLDGERGDRTIEMLRQLRERTAIGLVFLSNEMFWRRLTADRTREQLEKFTTRLAAKKFLRRKVTHKDVEAIAGRHLNSYTDEVLERLIQSAQGPGAFRAVAFFCQEAAQEAAKNGGNVTLEHLDRVAAVVEGKLEDMDR